MSQELNPKCLCCAECPYPNNIDCPLLINEWMKQDNFKEDKTKEECDNRINQYCGNCGNLWDFCECYEGLDLDEMKKQYNDITFEDVEGDIELTEEEE